MKIDLCNKLIDNDLSRNDLLERVEIENTSEDDIEQIVKTLSRAFDLSEQEVLHQFYTAKPLVEKSVKLVDRFNGDIYGLLIFCEFPIDLGSPIRLQSKELTEMFGVFKQVNGHSFIIDERLRGTSLDKKMLFHNLKFLSENYDFIWIGVENSLKSHKYWERLGFTEVFRIPEAVFYLLPLSEKMINEYLYK